MFQSTFPRGERHRASWESCREWGFQSTFPRGERQWRSAHTTRVNFVSIHVPTRGTTPLCADRIADTIVSIHVPTRGTTSAMAAGNLISGGFNPRSHEGNDSNHLQFLLIGLAGFYAIIPIYASQDKLYHL